MQSREKSVVKKTPRYMFQQNLLIRYKGKFSSLQIDNMRIYLGIKVLELTGKINRPIHKYPGELIKINEAKKQVMRAFNEKEILKQGNYSHMRRSFPSEMKDLVVDLLVNVSVFDEKVSEEDQESLRKELANVNRETSLTQTRKRKRDETEGDGFSPAEEEARTAKRMRTEAPIQSEIDEGSLPSTEDSLEIEMCLAKKTEFAKESNRRFASFPSKWGMFGKSFDFEEFQACDEQDLGAFVNGNDIVDAEIDKTFFRDLKL